MKVIPGEGIVSQHCLLLIHIVLKKKIRRKVKFRKKLKMSSLRELEMKEEFAKGVDKKIDGNENWYGLERKLFDVASEACDYTLFFHKHTGKLC